MPVLHDAPVRNRSNDKSDQNQTGGDHEYDGDWEAFHDSGTPAVTGQHTELRLDSGGASRHTTYF